VGKSLNHENLVSIKEVEFREEGSKYVLYITMEYYDSGDLKKLIKDKISKKETFSETEILEYFMQIAYGIQYLHEKNYVHRDIKPENIFLSSNYKIAKIGDFGLVIFCVKIDQKEKR
jgi:NIMA (never in mitosis gene a)-related kinase 1/4/5